jgi:Putative prokaryotic signal transducing protein
MTSDADRLETLTSTPNEPQAAMIVSALKDSGIDAVAEGGLTAGFRAETPGEVHIMVRQKDLDRARLALDEYRKTVTNIDWDEVDLGEAE